MKLEFEVIKETNGAFVAACFKERIYTEGNTLEELHNNIVKSLESHFTKPNIPHPSNIRLIIYQV